MSRKTASTQNVVQTHDPSDAAAPSVVMRGGSFQIHAQATQFLTDAEVVARYRNMITPGTLRNWRTQQIGPAYVKIGKAVLYPIEELDAWDRKQLIKRG